jgi:hypothetical protein
VRIFAREFVAIGGAARGGTIEITSNSDRRHSDNGTLEKFLL